jgi:hypothetical protein
MPDCLVLPWSFLLEPVLALAIDRVLVGMLMMPKVAGLRACFMLAIDGHRCPGHLERKPYQQKNTQQAAAYGE